MSVPSAVGHLLHFLVGVRQEFVQRRVEQADGHRQPGHDGEQLAEILPLERQQTRQRGAAAGFGVGDDHLADRQDALRVEEHVLGAAEADAFGAELAGGFGVHRGFGVGAHAHAAVLVGPFHQGAEIAGHRRLDHRDGADEDLAGGAVQGDRLAGADELAAGGQHLAVVVDADAAGAGDAGPPHAAGDHRGVAGHAAAGGQDALGGVHAVDVFRAGLDADQDDRLALGGAGFGLVGAEHHGAAGRARAGRQALAQQGARRFRVQHRVQQLVQRGRIDPHHRLGLVDQALARHVHRHAQRRRGGALAVARLQHVQLVLLHGELDVLHVLVVLFQRRADLHQFARRRRASPLPAGFRPAWRPTCDSGCGVRMPATTSSPCAFTRYSP